MGLLSFIGGIADGMVGATPEPKPRRAEPEAPRPNMFDTAFEEARQRQQQEREEADRRMVAKATILWGISAGPGQPRPVP